MPEQILEVETVDLQVAGEIGCEALSKQLAALIQHQFEFRRACRTIDSWIGVLHLAMLADGINRSLQGPDTAAEECSVHAHSTKPREARCLEVDGNRRVKTRSTGTLFASFGNKSRQFVVERFVVGPAVAEHQSGSRGLHEYPCS